MNALTSSIRRDDLAWNPTPPSFIQLVRPLVEDVEPCAEIIQFRPVRQSARDSRVALPPIPRTEDSCVPAQAHRDTRHATYRMDFRSVDQPAFVTVMPAYRHVSSKFSPASDFHSTRILHGGHLMHHFGIWIMALLPVQVLSAWMIGDLAGQTLGAGRYFHSVTWLLLMLASNIRVWMRYYGSESKAFQIPGIGLFLSAILPVLLLHLLARLQA